MVFPWFSHGTILQIVLKPQRPHGFSVASAACSPWLLRLEVTVGGRFDQPLQHHLDARRRAQEDHALCASEAPKGTVGG